MKVKVCWRSTNDLVCNILQWTSTHGYASAGHATRTYQQQLCTDTGCSLEDLPGAMDDRQMGREREWEGWGNPC